MIFPLSFVRRRLAALLLLGSVTLLVADLTPPPALPDDPACTAQDRTFMKRANELAAAASAKGNASYGALLVKDGQVLLEFSNDAITSGDSTHHAETGLLSAVSVKLGKAAFAGATLYTSTEPCPMCCGSIRAAGLRKFVYGVTAVQVIRLRGRPVPPQPLECREIFRRTGSGDVVILGPLLEAEGLAVHASAFVKTTIPAKP